MGNLVSRIDKQLPLPPNGEDQMEATGILDPQGRLADPGSIPGFNIPPYDEISAAYPNPTTEVYTYRKNLVTVAEITVVYTDGTKTALANASCVVS